MSGAVGRLARKALHRAAERESIGAYRLAWRKLLRHKLGRVGLVIFLLLVVLAIAAPLLAPYDPAAISYDTILSPPSWHNPLGTDDVGRDILSRVIFGARVSLEVITVSILTAIFLGSALGMVAGYLGGWVDQVIMRVMDGMLAFPML